MWLTELLEEHNVEFVYTGRNVTKNSVGIACPFCGDDPSQHLNLAVSGEKVGAWHCWRDATHRGRTPEYLLAVLLGKPIKEIRKITGGHVLRDENTLYDNFDMINPNTVWQPVRRARAAKESRGRSTKEAAIGEIITPMPLVADQIDYCWPAIAYLQERGFGDTAREVAEQYQLRYTQRGDYAYRIVLPLFFQGELVNLTSRAIGQSYFRYKTLPAEEAIFPIKSLLFHYDVLLCNPSHTLVITEGPFDAMKINQFGFDFGVRATCVFGNQVSMDQFRHLCTLAEKYTSVVALWDDKTYADLGTQSMVGEVLQPLPNYRTLPRFRTLKNRDPGDLSGTEMRGVAQEIHTWLKDCSQPHC